MSSQSPNPWSLFRRRMTCPASHWDSRPPNPYDGSSPRQPRQPRRQPTGDPQAAQKSAALACSHATKQERRSPATYAALSRCMREQPMFAGNGAAQVTGAQLIEAESQAPGLVTHLQNGPTVPRSHDKAVGLPVKKPTGLVRTHRAMRRRSACTRKPSSGTVCC